MLLVLLVACGGGNKGGGTAGGETKKLYDRLGGKDAIHAVVEDFIVNVKADAVIGQRFINADAVNLQKQLEDMICHDTGGPCEYKGKDMTAAHAGMNITEADFNALVGDLKKSLDKFKVQPKEQQELLGALAGYKAQIVTAK